MGKSNRDLMAMAALQEKMPEVEKILKETGFKVKGQWMSPKQVASMAMLVKLQEKGVTFDKVSDVLFECLEAETGVIVPTGKGFGEIQKIADHKTRLAAVKVFLEMVDIKKGFDIPDPDLDASRTSINIGFLNGGKEMKASVELVKDQEENVDIEE